MASGDDLSQGVARIVTSHNTAATRRIYLLVSETPPPQPGDHHHPRRASPSGIGEAGKVAMHTHTTSRDDFL